MSGRRPFEQDGRTPPPASPASPAGVHTPAYMNVAPGGAWLVPRFQGRIKPMPYESREGDWERRRPAGHPFDRETVANHGQSVTNGEEVATNPGLP